MSLASALSALKDGAAIQAADIDGAFDDIMDGAAAHEDIKQFLALTMPLMSHAPLIAAGARALRSRMVRITAPANAIDVCGTGGDGAHTLNISTAVAFVVAGCGVPVAKHGNRAMSSKSGAADVLEALGVKLTNDIPTLERALREANVAFLFAQNHHPAMRHVALARREIGKRTIFNLLGPLSNPAGVKRQLVGVFSADFLEPVANALRELGCEKAWAVHGAGGLDELSAQHRDANNVAILDNGAVTRVSHRRCRDHSRYPRRHGSRERRRDARAPQWRWPARPSRRSNAQRRRRTRRCRTRRKHTRSPPDRRAIALKWRRESRA
jgi:anthranilate phosphoribosyltransferase